MTMTPAEIVSDYRHSKTPAIQIGILADLNVCSTQEIVDILSKAGEPLPKKYLQIAKNQKGTDP